MVDPMPGAFVPQCDEKNPDLYKQMQCHGSTGKCWCVNQKTAEKLTDVLADGSCTRNEGNDIILTCKQKRDMVDPMPGAFVPQCDEKNPDLYKQMQCHGSTGKCWCVNQQTAEKLTDVLADGTCSKSGPVVGRPSGECNHGFQWCAAESKCYRAWEEDCDGISAPLDVYGVIVDVDKDAKVIVVQVNGEEI
eukprot:Hpha_TRINITY_DN15241_c2_g8::TRINITY_DN15241_c2_g8_i1::g.66279::m.66279